MNNMAKQENCNVETYDYENDFKFLTLKEKQVVLKDAIRFLKLQKENAVLFDVGFCEKQRCISL
jgi:hypothetical protein